jgi:hypothetical protein
MPHHEELDQATVDRIARQAIEDVSPDDIESPALRRLIEDVRDASDTQPATPQLYNRMYNRHNRGR